MPKIFLSPASPPEACPDSYFYSAGDIHGPGSVRTIPSVSSISSCGRLCDNDSACCSFEYSQWTDLCNLNKECLPTASVYQDFDFCVKGDRSYCKVLTFPVLVLLGRLFLLEKQLHGFPIRFPPSGPPAEACPASYFYNAGDVQGSGSIRSISSVSTISYCAGYCDTDSTCSSFEYSPREHLCNLNSEVQPDAAVYRDQDFCVKGEKNSLASLHYIVAYVFTKTKKNQIQIQNARNTRHRQSFAVVKSLHLLKVFEEKEFSGFKYEP